MTETARIAHDEDGIRVDRWFKRHYPALNHGRLEKLLRTGQVRLDGKRVKSADRVVAGKPAAPPEASSLWQPGACRAAGCSSIGTARPSSVCHRRARPGR